MTEQLISFETAKLACIQGFDEQCGLHYSYGNGDSAEPETGHVYIGGFLDDGMSPRKYNNTELGKYDWGLPYGNFSAPTQGFLQKWLRENHKIHLMIKPWDNDEYQIFVLYDDPSEKYSEEVNFDNLYKTYEAALEAGLLEALNLIA